jgi:hypothetical protein
MRHRSGSAPTLGRAACFTLSRPAQMQDEPTFATACPAALQLAAEWI